MKYRVIFLIDLLIFPITACLLVSVFISADGDKIPYLALNGILTFSILLSLVLFYLALGWTVSSLEAEKKRELLEQHREILRIRDREIKELSSRSSDKLQDFYVHLARLESHISRKEYPEAKAYIEQLSRQYLPGNPSRFCSDPFLNTLLSVKAEEAEKNHIQTDFQIFLPPVNSFGRLDPPELSSILLNLLDNGIEGCQDSGSAQPFLRLELSCRSGILRIRMENSKNPAVTFTGTTTKSNRSFHGFGLKIIEQIVKDHQGECIWRDKGTCFESQLTLNTNV